jgi:2-keto-4-pentenoate hydratase
MSDPASPAVESAAELLAGLRRSGNRFGGFSSALRPIDEGQAYSIQASLHRRLAGHGWGPVVGHKIGCTTPVMQAYLGIANPCAGGVFDKTVHRGSGHFAIPNGSRLGVECEIAVWMGGDLDSDRSIDEEQASDAVASCAAAIEVVEDRYVDYRSLGAPTLIADDFFGAGCVLGPAVPDVKVEELASATATMWINGVAVGSGTGADVLGNPLRALTWLANNLVNRGQALRKGEFVLLGSLVQTNWVKPGDVVSILNQPLGEAQATFS